MREAFSHRVVRIVALPIMDRNERRPAAARNNGACRLSQAMPLGTGQGNGLK
jgi:hypothetical protein